MKSTTIIRESTRPKSQKAISPDQHNNVTLCVDLDGTLVQTDLFLESVFALLYQRPFYIFLSIFWIMRGKAYLKQRVAELVVLDVVGLPYHDEFLAYLRRERDKGRKLVLATAADRKIANQIVNHIGLFEQVIASDGHLNTAGKHKLAKIKELVGNADFDYAGNALVDLKIWRCARRAILVVPEPGVQSAAESVTEVERVFDGPFRQLRDYVQALRLHQWVKNLLVFVPLAAAHRIGDIDLLAQASMAFLSFGLCASSVYLLNDLVDLPADRRHPRKRHRPFAAGRLPIKHGVALIPVLLLGAFALALLLPIQFLLVLCGYYLLTLAYSLWLKKMVMIDVLTLAGLFTSRIIGGSAAVDITPSFWLLAFSMFLFLSLAMVKRYAELLVARSQGEENITSRDYRTDDLHLIASLGAASGYSSVLVLALYINSDAMTIQYSNPGFIWLICPLLVYWLSRVWLKAHRGEMNDDPVVFAITDKASIVTGMLCVLVVWLAI